MSNLEAMVGKDELKYAIDNQGVEHNFTSLAPDFSNCDPDDGFSVVPYEKGYTFIYYMESLVGKENFKKIMQTYITKYSYLSITHEHFKEVYESEVKNIFGGEAESKVLSKIDWDKWIKTTGYPIMDFEYSKIIFEN